MFGNCDLECGAYKTAYITTCIAIGIYWTMRENYRGVAGIEGQLGLMRRKFVASIYISCRITLVSSLPAVRSAVCAGSDGCCGPGWQQGRHWVGCYDRQAEAKCCDAAAADAIMQLERQAALIIAEDRRSCWLGCFGCCQPQRQASI